MKIRTLLNENVDKQAIKAFCDRYNIVNYTINDDGTVDVWQDVNLMSTTPKLTAFPFKFGVVDGSFLCNGNQLTSLAGAPKEVAGDFDCSQNPLTSLVGGPREVHGSYDCYSTDIHDLKGSPNTIGAHEYLDCSYCKNLQSLQGLPKHLNRLICTQQREGDRHFTVRDLPEGTVVNRFTGSDGISHRTTQLTSNTPQSL